MSHLALTLRAQLNGGLLGTRVKIASISSAASRFLLAEHNTRRCFQERAAGRSTEPCLPPPATSQLRLGPHAPPARLSYQQEPAEHTAGFLHQRNSSIDHCCSPFPSSPSSPAPPNTRGYAWCTCLISPEMGTSQKATQVLIWRYRRGLQGAATAPLAKRVT